jgi:hypothetical protein
VPPRSRSSSAHHFTQAGLDDLAIEWWGKAGDQALRRSAFEEAIAHLGKAIAMADEAANGTASGASDERTLIRVFAELRALGYGGLDLTDRGDIVLGTAAGVGAERGGAGIGPTFERQRPRLPSSTLFSWGAEPLLNGDSNSCWER